MSIINRALLIAALLASTLALARSDGIYNPASNSTGDYQGIDSNAPSGTPPAGSFLLSNTGSALLVNTGVKFLVQ